MAWGRDPARRIVTTALTGSGTDVNHYAGGGDSPAWVGHADGGFERVVTGPAGGVSVLATTTAAGATAAALQIGDPHGDIVATAALTAGRDVTGADVVLGADFDEYGVNGTTTAMPASPGYGWEGVNARSASTTLGLVLMGARLYNPATGRFLTLDPVPGGNANPYAYPADPVNGEDLTGEFFTSKREMRACAAQGPRRCRRIAAIAAFALAQAPGEGDAQNARRHFVLASLMSLSIGRKRTITVLASHEPPNSATWKKDEWRDWNNNYAGLDAADEVRSWARWMPGPLNPARVALVYRQYRKWGRQHRLWCADGRKKAELC